MSDLETYMEILQWGAYASFLNTLLLALLLVQKTRKGT